ncbi:hypothetical protein D3C85_1327020 [compost metagenome]
MLAKPQHKVDAQARATVEADIAVIELLVGRVPELPVPGTLDFDGQCDTHGFAHDVHAFLVDHVSFGIESDTCRCMFEHTDQTISATSF